MRKSTEDYIKQLKKCEIAEHDYTMIINISQMASDMCESEILDLREGIAVLKFLNFMTDYYKFRAENEEYIMDIYRKRL